MKQMQLVCQRTAVAQIHLISWKNPSYPSLYLPLVVLRIELEFYCHKLNVEGKLHFGQDQSNGEGTSDD